jgi:hypothetical protein
VEVKMKKRVWVNVLNRRIFWVLELMSKGREKIGQCGKGEVKEWARIRNLREWALRVY